MIHVEETPTCLKIFTNRCFSVNRLVHTTVLTAMLLHSILGCCWHHGHSHTEATCQTDSNVNRPVQSRVQSTHSHSLHHACSHHHAPASSPSDHEQVPHQHQCDQDDCHFLLTKSWEFPLQLELSLAFETTVLTVVPQVVECSLTQQISRPKFDTAGSRCAVLQVWRI